jgi:hypothetical protein
MPSEPAARVCFQLRNRNEQEYIANRISDCHVTSTESATIALNGTSYGVVTTQTLLPKAQLTSQTRSQRKGSRGQDMRRPGIGI